MLRTAGAMASAVMLPVQAAQEAAALTHWVRGANFRLGKDVVGLTGVHYGRVIEIPYSGGSFDVGTKHRMVTMLDALETSSYRDMPLESVAA